MAFITSTPMMLTLARCRIMPILVAKLNWLHGLCSPLPTVPMPEAESRRRECFGGGNGSDSVHNGGEGPISAVIYCLMDACPFRYWGIAVPTTVGKTGDGNRGDAAK